MPSSRRSLLPALVAALVAAVCVVAAPVAGADSIVYLRAGNVWLISPDGQRGYQVTFDGGWDSPSQADDGTIMAAKGTQLVRLDRSGHVLSAIGAVGGETSTLLSDKFKLFGPFDPEISPDGKRVAYWGTAYNPWSSPDAIYSEFRDVTVVTASDHVDVTPSSWVTSVKQPSWIGNDRVLIAGSGLTNYNFETWRPQVGEDQLQWWFRNTQAVDNDPELSPDGKKLVSVAQTNGLLSPANTLLFFRVPGPSSTEAPYPHTWQDDAPHPPAGELMCANVRDSDAHSPSWAPGANAIAYDDKDGIWIQDVPGLDAPCAGTPLSEHLLVVGGTHPDWGPADIDVAQKPQTPSPPSAGGAGEPGTPPVTTPGSPTTNAARVLSLKVGANAKRRVGVAVAVTLDAPTRVTITVCHRRGGRCAGKAAHKSVQAAAGTTKVVVPVRKLRRGAYVVVVQPVGGTATVRRVRLV